MSKDLTNSGIARQNILNNRYALQEIQTAVGIKGILFESEYRFTKKQLAKFFEVSVRTIENYIEENKAELMKNGYEVIVDNRLNDFKLIVQNQFDPEMDFGTKTRRLSIYNFRAFLNLSEFAMAVICLVSGIMLLKNMKFARMTNMAGLAMVVFSTINAAGYYGQKGETPMMVMFIVMAVVSIAVICGHYYSVSSER